MSQAPNDGMSLLDPWGFWKTARDTNLEVWSKLMIDLVNSNEYAQATGFALEQALATSQPLRDSIERTMTQTLGMLNMPTRVEVITIAERLVNVEMRLDDMDAKLNTMQKALEQTIKKTIQEALSERDSHLKGLASQLDAIQDEGRQANAKYGDLKKIEAQLGELSSKLSSMQIVAPIAPAPRVAPAVPAARPPAAKPAPKPQPKIEAKVEAKPQPKAAPQTRHEPNGRKAQEAK